MPAFRPCAALLGASLGLLLPTPSAAGVCDPIAALGDPVSVVTGANPLHTLVADFNEDGVPDLAVSNSNWLGDGTGSLAILLGTGGGAFGPPSSIVATGQPHFLAAGDFNQDGILDLAMTRKFDLRVAVYLGLGSGGVGNGTFAPAASFPTNGQPFQIVAGDYDEDGVVDLAVAINNAPRVQILRGAGGGFSDFGSYPLGDFGRAIAQGDFNSDGILDLVASEYMDGTVAVLLGNGSGGVGNGMFAAAVHYAAGPEPVDIEVLDYDRDGILDLAVANGTSAGIRVLRGLGAGGIGNGAFSLVASLPTGNTPGVTVADVNEDGLLDLLGAEDLYPVGRRIHLFLGNGASPVGDGTWTSAGAIPVDGDPYQVTMGDLNLDGHDDAVVTDFRGNKIILLTWGCRETPPDPRYPVLTRVRDVPNDEGGRVYLTWLPSSLDVPGGAVTSYRVWRQIPESEAKAPAPGARTTTRTESAPGGGTTVTFWEEIATLAAQRLEGYGYTAPTTEDSTAQHPVSSAFFVTALTSNLNVFYSSNVASGASVDNKPPQTPRNFRAETSEPGAFALAWSPNEEPDLAAYRLERSLSAAFPEEGTTGVVVESDTAYVGAASTETTYWRLAAVDVHGNVGPFAPTITQGAVGVDGGTPRVLALAGARPNPATAGEATLLFSLASDEPATLEVYDVRGRRVAAPSLEGFGPGDHAIRLDRHVALAPGVYVVRLRQGGGALERKLAVTP